MTENKRFQIIHLGNPYDFVVKDHQTDRTYGTLQGDYKSLQECLDNISDENEQLKSDNECYVKRYSELFEDYIACKKENEQLKKTNQELNDELQETIGYLSLKSGVEKENEQLKQQNKGIQDKVWKLLELLEKEKGIDKRKIIDWWNGDVE